MIEIRQYGSKICKKYRLTATHYHKSTKYAIKLYTNHRNIERRDIEMITNASKKIRGILKYQGRNPTFETEINKDQETSKKHVK